MPRPPHVAPRLADIGGSVFSRLAPRIRELQGPVFALHVGDSYLRPAVELSEISAREHPDMHRYALPQGHSLLLEAIERRRGVDRERVLVTAGATGALSAISGALLSPGDEVLVLAPFWPLIPGVVRAAGGIPVQVPFYDREGTVEERLAPYLTGRTVALYVNSPNNPTGRVLDRAHLAALAAFARAHDLWLWSDEVYEDYAFEGTHHPIAALAPERSFSVYSFSKAYAMAGNRCGYIVGPEPGVMRQVRKLITHSFYSTPTAAQIAAARVLDQGDEWVARARQRYRQAGRRAAEILGVPAPAGGTFIFLDVADALDEGGLEGFLLRCLDQNLLVAPGSACGRDYGTWVRACFTSEPPDVMAQGFERLSRVLSRP